MRFIIYNIARENEGKMLRIVGCPAKYMDSQVKDSEYIMKAPKDVNDATQKIKFDGLDVDGQPVNSRVVNKTLEEIEIDNPSIPEVPFEKQIANITNKQWQDILKRIRDLEN